MAGVKIENGSGRRCKEGKATGQRYDKGERRFKHVGKGAHPVFEFHDSEPKTWVGKCPSTLSERDRTKLLNEAIGAPNCDRHLPVPKKLYVV